MANATDEQWLRASFDDIAGSVAVDEAFGRPQARAALRRRTRRRTARRVGGAIVAVVLVALGSVALLGPSGRHTVHTVKPAPTTAPVPNRRIPRALTVVARLDGRWAPEPVAYDGHDVWIAHEDSNGTAPLRVEVERRAAASGRRLATVEVPQEAVFGIAADGAGSVWVAGGGDGGVPETSVSRIDVRTGAVVFTRTLTSDPCSCSIAAGAGGAWLGGNGSESVLRLDRRTGAVTARIALPRPSSSIAVVGDRVQVGLDDSRVAIIDPVSNRVARTITVAAPSQPPSGRIVAIAPVGGAAAVDSWVTRSDGIAFEIAGNTRIGAAPVAFLRPFGITSTTLSDGLLWSAGVDQVLVSDTGAGRELGYANYDQDRGSFGPVQLRTKRFVPTVAPEGLSRIVAAGGTLWLSEFNGSILVVRPH